MNTTTDNLAAALRACVPFLDCMNADNTREMAAASRAALAAYDAEQAKPAEPVRIVISMDGGLVHWIGTDSAQRILAAVIDYDTDGMEDDELTEIPQDDGDMADAHARIEQADASTPEWIAAAFAAIDATP
jgi:hypothetical protein